MDSINSLNQAGLLAIQARLRFSLFSRQLGRFQRQSRAKQAIDGHELPPTLLSLLVISSGPFWALR